MFKKVLIANRGEIAVRVIRACRLLGVETVAIFSDADKDALHVELADEAYRVGPPPASESYLNIESIISLAKKSGAEAIHPGYGFLSENSMFSGSCEREGIKFVGPSSKTLLTAGNKAECKRLVQAEGVPVIPGTGRIIEDEDEAKGVADSMGYPVLLKSAYGGGGRGIREVKGEREFKAEFSTAIREAKSAFGRAGMYIEKLISPARHIEIQVLGDGKGDAIHLGERECSIQRRHQKLVELTPSPVVNENVRKKVGGYAVKVAQVLKYENAGTMEFLRDEQGNFYFMEVNSRLQVEHPVTEAVTGLDLVKEQFLIASTGRLPLSQKEVVRNGAAMECRINAEDPYDSFAPAAGTVERVHFPGGPGVRVDTMLYDGYTIPEYYDSLIAKLIVRGDSLEDTRQRMISALSEFSVTGIKTTVPFHSTLLQSEVFKKWEFSTNLVEKSGILEQLAKQGASKKQEFEELGVVIAAAIMAKGIHKVVDLESIGNASSGWRPSLGNRGAPFFDEV